jgi:hypothetical protein
VFAFGSRPNIFEEMKVLGLCLVLFAFIIGDQKVTAVFVKVKQHETKCFIEMIRHDIVLVHYKSPDQAELPHDPEAQKQHVGLNLEVFSEKGKVFEGRTEQKGRFAFTTLAHGEHRLCFRYHLTRCRYIARSAENFRQSLQHHIVHVQCYGKISWAGLQTSYRH